MDPFLEPIKSVLPSGLTVITMRAGKEGIIAGELRLGVGAAHAAQMNPAWEGLPHFLEHMTTAGASRHYQQDEIEKIMRDRFYLGSYNAYTGLAQTRFFTTPGASHILPKRYFWDAFSIMTDGVFFPKFDTPTLERERERVLEEMSKFQTKRNADGRELMRRMHGANYLGLDVLGTREQVRGYTQDDCFALHQATYGLNNTTVTLTGDVDHHEAVDRLQSILSDVPSLKTTLPLLETPKFQGGEFRCPVDGVNAGSLNIYLNFPAPNLTSPAYYPTALAADALATIISDEVKSKFGLYVASFRYEGWNQKTPIAYVELNTGDTRKSSSALQYALEIMQRPETYQKIADGHKGLVERRVVASEVSQPAIEEMSNTLNDFHAIGAELLSADQRVERFRQTTSEQVAEILRGFASSKIFLNVGGHERALNELASIAVINSWRPEASSAPPTKPNPT